MRPMIVGPNMEISKIFDFKAARQQDDAETRESAHRDADEDGKNSKKR